MKKILLASTMALCGLMNAQMNFGVKAGYSLSNVHFKDVTEQPEQKSGVYAGLFTEYKFTKNIAFQGELLYSNLGFKVSKTHKYDYLNDAGFSIPNLPTNSYDVTSTYSANLNTLMIPLAVKFYLLDQFALAGGVNLGWVFSGVIKTKQEYGSADNILDRHKNKHNTDDLNAFSAAPFVGVSYSVIPNLSVEARYNYGITDIYKSPSSFEKEGKITAGLNGKNRFLQIGLAYKF